MAGAADPDETVESAADPWFRPVWEDEPDETSTAGPASRPLGGAGAARAPATDVARLSAAAGTQLPLFRPSPGSPHPGAGTFPHPLALPPLLEPLCDAHDALARLDARAAVAPAAIREGLCARLAYREAAGWLTHVHAWVHPLDLALHDLGLTFSFEIAAHAGQSARVMRHTAAGRAHTVWEDHDPAVKARGDTMVAHALTLARWLRRLALSRDHDPFACAASASALLTGFDVSFLDGERFRQWRAAFPLPQAGAARFPDAAGLPVLLRAAAAAARWMECGIVELPEPLHAVLAAVCFLQRTGPWRAALVPVWACYPVLGTGNRAVLPELRQDVAARLPGQGSAAAPGGDPSIRTAWPLAFLHLVAEGARAGVRELDRLEALAGQGAQRLAHCDRRSRLPDALEAVLRAPALTPKALAARLAIAPQTATSLLRELRAAGLVRELTGRRSFRAFAAQA